MPSGSSGPPGVPRYTTLQRRLLTLSAGVGVAALAGALFVLSFDDLRALALAGRAARRFASFYPVMYDTLIAVTILSLVVARHARWWSRWSRWLLLFVLVGGAAAASVQRAVDGYDPLPDQTLVAGVAGAPHAMLVIAVVLWITMFRQARAALARRAGEGRPARSVPEPESEGQAGAEIGSGAGAGPQVGAWTAAEAGFDAVPRAVPSADAVHEGGAEPVPMRHMAEPSTDQPHAYGARTSRDLVPGMTDMTEQHPPLPLTKEPEREEERPERRSHGVESWLDVGEDDPVRTGPAHTHPVRTGPAHTHPVHTAPAHTDPAHTDAAHTDAGHTDPADAQPVHAQPVYSEPADPEPQADIPSVPFERAETSESAVPVEPAEPSEPAKASDAADTDLDTEPEETEPHLGVVHEEEPPRPAPASLPTDVKLVGRAPAGPAATTWPDIVIADPPDPAEDDIDASGADRAEDPDAGEDEPTGSGRFDGEDHETAAGPGAGETLEDVDRWNAAGAEDVQRWATESTDGRPRWRYREPSEEPARNVEWPPSSKFRSSPTPPTD